MNQKITKPPVVGAATDVKVQILNTEHNITSLAANHSVALQRQRLSQYLKEKGSITTPEARFNLDIPHPAGRINELRKRGHRIVTVMVKDHNPGGTDHRFAKYLLQSSRGTKQ